MLVVERWILAVGTTLILLAVLTVSYHTTAVAVTNPARSLRYE